MNDLKELGIPNVCFSLADEITENDELKEKYKQQRIERGFDDSELWNLDYTIASFVLPRLKRFKELNTGYPAILTEDSWDKILDTMIEAFELKVNDNDDRTLEEDKIVDKKMQEGFKLFGKYFLHLWW